MCQDSSATPPGGLARSCLVITIAFAYAPMNHFFGRGMIFSTLAPGGTAFFALNSGMSTLFEDLRLIRPTLLSFIPRVCKLIHQHYQPEVQRLVAKGSDRVDADRQVRAEMSRSYLGDRLVSAGTGSSPTAPEVREFLAECFDIAFIEDYGSTLITGDIMEERGPDHIFWVDRRNNVIKLSQAEFVAIGRSNRPIWVAAMQMAEKTVCAHRSQRVAMRRQSFSRPKTFSMLCRC